MQKDKIGVGIITCDRPDYFRDALESIFECILDGKLDNGSLVVVDDGLTPIEEHEVNVIKTTGRIGVGKAKNIAFRELLKDECEHIFILEDDCIITNTDVFNLYINAYKETGLKHFNFGPGSPWNRLQSDPSMIGDLTRRGEASQTGFPNPKVIIHYKNDVSITLYEHIVAMFSYYHASVLDKVGLMDEDFYNAWEHVEHTYRIIQAGDYTPFWWFADVLRSEEHIKEQKDEKANTSLAKNEDEFMKRVQDGLQIFYKKHNTIPSTIPPVNGRELNPILRRIYENHRR